MVTPENGDRPKAPSLLRVLSSVLASMFGVQSSHKREADFAHGKASHFIIIGLVVTLIFILAVWGVVLLVMSVAGA